MRLLADAMLLVIKKRDKGGMKRRFENEGLVGTTIAGTIGRRKNKHHGSRYRYLEKGTILIHLSRRKNRVARAYDKGIFIRSHCSMIDPINVPRFDKEKDEESPEKPCSSGRYVNFSKTSRDRIADDIGTATSGRTEWERRSE